MYLASSKDCFPILTYSTWLLLDLPRQFNRRLLWSPTGKQIGHNVRVIKLSLFVYPQVTDCTKKTHTWLHPSWKNLFLMEIYSSLRIRRLTFTVYRSFLFPQKYIKSATVKPSAFFCGLTRILTLLHGRNP